MQEYDEDSETPQVHVHPPTVPEWPECDGVPVTHRRRAWCLLQAEGLIPNVGGRDPQVVAGDMIRVADVFEAWITHSVVPHKLSIVEKP
jgi:hypothetical protein